MGAYDAGRYATPLIARTNSIGETVITGYKFGQFFLVLEEGLGGQLGRRPSAWFRPAGMTSRTPTWARPLSAMPSWSVLCWRRTARFALPWAWTKDDQVPGGQIPNGRIQVFGADLNVTAGRAGHLYFGFARTEARNAATVSGAIEILNARGGPELMAQYLGTGTNRNGLPSAGNGSLTTFGAQYDLSVSRLVFGSLYTGTSPDILLSLFGIGTAVKSDEADRDGVFKVKVGGEATYLMMSWLGVSERVITCACKAAIRRTHSRFSHPASCSTRAGRAETNSHCSIPISRPAAMCTSRLVFRLGPVPMQTRIVTSSPCPAHSGVASGS